MIAGSIVGTFLLHNIDTTKIKLIFGAVVVFIGLEMFFSQVFQLKMHKPLLVIIGVLSGLLCGLFGIGALLSAYIGKVTKTSFEFKANISAVFAVENTKFGVGLENAKTRLELQCGGRLEITSRPGCTKATVFVPKQKADIENEGQ